MNTFKLVISSPDGNVFNEDVLSISLRGIEGELAIMSGHIPFIAVIKPCTYKIQMPNGEEKTGRTEGGILTVSKEKTTYLSGRTEI
jgi:F-type H+-transporting ATPase subunit epsilon